MPHHESPDFSTVNKRVSILYLHDPAAGYVNFNYENLRSDWYYDPTDPYAVSVTIHDDESQTSYVWDFERNLLSRGLDEDAGKGDVHFMPLDSSPHRPTRWLTSMRLSSPERTAVFLLPRMPLRQFLQQTYVRVPVGKEGRIVQWFLGVELMMLFDNPDNLTN